MKENAYLVIGRTGIRGVRKTKPSLQWDEIACKIYLDVPDELFRRPQLEATIIVDKDKVIADPINPNIVINTKELIEQQAGVKIDFRVVEYEKKEPEEE